MALKTTYLGPNTAIIPQNLSITAPGGKGIIIIKSRSLVNNTEDISLVVGLSGEGSIDDLDDFRTEPETPSTDSPIYISGDGSHTHTTGEEAYFQWDTVYANNPNSQLVITYYEIDN